MSNVSIYEKNWIDLVFEDKNKAYGAYKLRQENPRTTLFAFFGGILFLFFLIGLWYLSCSFGGKPIAKPIEEDSFILKVTDFNPPKKEKTVKPKSLNIKNFVEPKNLSHMAVAATPEVVIDVPTHDNLSTKQNSTTEVGTGIETPTDAGNSTGTISIPVVDKDPATPNELDRLPEYPGGINKFYEYVGNSIEKPDSDFSSSSISVIMSFVIEKDGAMTDIKVLRSSDKNLEKEAIHVLKALRTKWSPGFKDGVKVRTLYTLPIKVTI